MGILENLQKIKKSIPEDTVLVAVSKTKPAEMILELYHAGHKDFGENKVQDLVAKHEQLPGDIQWHMIGHLQSNKVKYIAPFVHLIHGVDSLKLLGIVNKEAVKNDRVLSCLLQVHIAEESSKFGLNEEEILGLLSSEEFLGMHNIAIRGLMGMATFTENSERVRKEFQNLKCIFEKVKENYFRDDPAFSVLSMGMSGDYPIAIEEGSNMLRVGSLIFGPRNTTF